MKGIPECTVRGISSLSQPRITECDFVATKHSNHGLFVDETHQVGLTFASVRLAPARDRSETLRRSKVRLQARIFVYRCQAVDGSSSFAEEAIRRLGMLSLPE